MRNSLFVGFVFSSLIFFISCSGNKNRDIIFLGKESQALKDDQWEHARSNPLINGYVPDSLTAIKIAEAIWVPIYGENIYEYLPFEAVLINDSIWIVSGTVHTTKGGSPFAEIKKKNGMIINVYHEE
jgi:hypothetical protein